MIKHSTAPFHLLDLDICQRVFDEILATSGTDKSTEEGERIAAILVECYRQGVHDPVQLKTMVRAARGLFEDNTGSRADESLQSHPPILPRSGPR